MAEKLTEIYKGWSGYQELLINAISPLSAEQLAFRAAPHLRTIGQIAAHVVGARARWMQMGLGNTDAAVAPLKTWGSPDDPAHTAGELVNGLEITWRALVVILGSHTTADLPTLAFNGKWHGEDTALTWEWIIWHLIEHDTNHGGEMSLTLGMHQLPGLGI